eukprot:403353335
MTHPLGQSKNIRISIYLKLIFGLTLFLSQEYQSSCEYGFPHLLGGSEDQTLIHGVDMLDDLIVIAGGVHDSTVSSIADGDGRPYIALISKGNQYLWSKVFDSMQNTFIMAKFSKEGDKVITMNDRSPQHIVVLYTSNGEVSKNFVVMQDWVTPRIGGYSTFYYDNSIYIAALTTSQNQFLVISIVVNNIRTFRTNTEGFGASILRSGNQNLTYVGGMQKQSGVSYATFSILNNQAQVLSNSFLNTSTVFTLEQYVSQMAILPNYLVGIDQVVGTVIIDNQQMQIFTAEVSHQTQEVGSSRLLKLSVQFSKCLHIYVNSSNITGLIVNDMQNRQIYLEINLTDFKVVVSKSAVLFYNSNYKVTSGVWSSKYGPIIAGYSSQVAGSNSLQLVSFSQTVGFVTALDKIHRCNGDDFVSISQPLLTFIIDVFKPLNFSQNITQDPLGYYSAPYPIATFTNPYLTKFNCTSLNYYKLTGFKNLYADIYIGMQYQHTRLTPIADCGGSTFTITVLLNDTLSDPGTVASSVMSYNEANLIIYFRNNNRSQDGKKFYIHVHAFLYQSWQYYSYTLALQLHQDPCEKVEVTSSPMKDVFFDIYFGNGVFLNYLNWTQTYKKECPIIYKNVAIDNNIGSIHTQWWQKSEISMISSNLNRTGNYTVLTTAYVTNNTVSGSQQNSIARETFQMTIVDQCRFNKPIVPNSLQNSHKVNFQQRMQITLETWQLPYTYCGQIVRYYVFGLPSFANFNNQTQNIEIYPVSNPAHIGNFTFQILAYIDVGNNRANSTIQVVEAPFLYNIPTETFQFEDYFTIKDQEVKAGQILTQSIFKSQDLQQEFLKNFNLKIDFAQAFMFSHYSNSKNIFSPPQNSNGASYKIRLQVTSKKTGIDYRLNYVVKVISEATQLEESISQQNLTSTPNQDIQFYKFKYLKITTQIRATMSSISRYGVFTLYFNDTLLVPKISSFINTEQALKFQVRDGLTDVVDYSKQNVTNFTVQKYNSKYIQIKLEFSNPKILSQQSVRQIVFKIIVIRQIGMHI